MEYLGVQEDKSDRVMEQLLLNWRFQYGCACVYMGGGEGRGRVGGEVITASFYVVSRSSNMYN